MALDDRLIQGRRVAYLCCAADFDAKWTEALIYGDQECAKKNKRLALAYLWAYDVMSRYPLSTEDGCCGDCKCVTDDFALAVIEKMDPGCVHCGCGCSKYPLTCEIEFDYMVGASVDASYQPAAQPDTPYLIVSDLNSWGGTWAQHLNEIVNNDAFTVIPVGKVIKALLNPDEYWIQTPSGVGQLFPYVGADRNGFDVTFTSRYPAVNSYLNRNVIIFLSEDADTWVPVYAGTEGALATPLTITTNSDQWLYVKATYYYNDYDFYNRTVPGYVESGTPPQQTYSIKLDAQTNYAVACPLPTGTMQFQPFRESRFVLSFNMSVQDIQFPDFFFVPWTYVGSNDALPATGNFSFLTALYSSVLEYGVQVSVTEGLNSYARIFVFPGVYAIITDGNFHNVTLVRNDSTAGMWEGDDKLVMYVDGIPYNAQLAPGSIGVAYANDIDLPYTPAPMDLSSVASTYIGDQFVFANNILINNFYIATYAPTALEVLSICVPAAYEGNDGPWNRQAWLRARQPDRAAAPPYMNAWSSQSPNWFGLSGPSDISLVPDKPDWVAP